MRDRPELAPLVAALRELIEARKRDRPAAAEAKRNIQSAAANLSERWGSHGDLAEMDASELGEDQEKLIEYLAGVAAVRARVAEDREREVGMLRAMGGELGTLWKRRIDALDSEEAAFAEVQALLEGRLKAIRSRLES